MKILALDVSGAATGWAIGIDGKLESFGKFIGKVTQSKGRQLYEFSKWIEEILKEKSPDIIIIERPFRGRNSNVLAQISKFIAIVELSSVKILDLDITSDHFLDPKSVKKNLKVKKGRNHDDNKKIMVKRINAIYGLHLKYIKNKAKAYNDDDSADAIALLHAWWSFKGNK